MSIRDDKEDACALCGRGGLDMNKHHLIPRSRGGAETVGICLTCHKQIHALFDNQTLARDLGSIEALQENPAMRSYLNWVRKRRGWFKVRRKK